MAALSYPIFWLFFRYRAYGKEHLPAAGGYVLAAGHVSNIDPWPLGLAVFPHRFLRFMAKSELFWFPLGWLIRAAGAFEVHRGTADRAAIETAVELAREGNVIAMFPEGTRRTKGLRKKFTAQAHTGAARIARDAGVPLVPAGIRGTNQLVRFGPVRVRYGAPVEVSDDLDATTERLMSAIAELEASL
ncbi:MAG TPA: lysophospholipid acyltransferase family protein [Gaiellaceae bacterium]|nr:lysophospholipid acyltransferase family protein [Gaiellaceae bacterium]